MSTGNSTPGQEKLEEHVKIQETSNDLIENHDATMSTENPDENDLSATQLEMSIENGTNQSHNENGAKIIRGGPSKGAKKTAEGKHVLRSMDTPRVLRSRTKEINKISEPGSNLPDQSDGTNGDNTRKKKKKTKKQTKDVKADEFSRTRKHLKYLLHKMAYEQNLIDAYSGEGWKGQSAEKLRPEKELQRAKSEIFRCKLKIRDLFQRIDVSISEGRMPETLFDEEGEIDSEDIFCAKCGLKDVTLENDIILCDGACERAFHQSCVEPPLLCEDIPPDEEGWLCPGCDCKDDCIDLINESQETELDIMDSWEKVYPEAAAAAACGKTLDNVDLPSDDSEDDDFKPDDSEMEDKDAGDESSSDESDNYSASEEDAEVAPVNGQNLQIPSDDDSEDDDFDPDAADVDDEVKKETSGSDFTSDSEDLNAVIDANNGPPHENSTESMHGPSNVGRGKRPLLNDDVVIRPILPRREVERLDYKKLYDDQYGDVPTDSSDEEFFDAVDAPKRRRKNDTNTDSGKTPKRRTRKKLDNLLSQQGSSCASAKISASKMVEEASTQEQDGNVSTESSNDEYFDAADAHKRRRKNNIDSEKSPKRRARKKLISEGTNGSPVKTNKVPSEPGSSSARAKTSANRRLGEVVTQGLLLSFKENQFPDRAMKEKLSAELGITVHQVNKWFMNARWSYRHSSLLETKLANLPSNGTPAKINPIVAPDISLNVVKSDDQSEEQTDGKSHIPIDPTKDSTNTLEAQKIDEKGGRLDDEKCSSSTPNKNTNMLSKNLSSNEDTQKSCGPVEVSEAPQKKTRGKAKKF